MRCPLWGKDGPTTIGLRIADFRLRISDFSFPHFSQSVALGWYALPSLGQRQTDDHWIADCGLQIADF
jgi:hypothetical protein